MIPLVLDRVGHSRRAGSRRSRLGGLPALALLVVLAVAACGSTAPDGTPPITPGTSGQPREVNIIMRDYGYAPAVVDLVPGESVLLHLVNGGLDVHEVVLGDLDAQLAWDAAEAATIGHPPGPTPAVSVPPEVRGLRIVVPSGARVDVAWTVPVDAAGAADGWFVGCHIPGHWEKGMVVPIRFVDAAGRPIGTVPPAPLPTPGG